MWDGGSKHGIMEKKGEYSKRERKKKKTLKEENNKINSIIGVCISAVSVLIVPVVGSSTWVEAVGRCWNLDQMDTTTTAPDWLISGCHRTPRESWHPEQSPSASSKVLDRFLPGSFHEWEGILSQILCLNKHKMFKEVLFASSEAGVSKVQWNIFFCQLVAGPAALQNCFLPPGKPGRMHRYLTTF